MQLIMLPQTHFNGKSMEWTIHIKYFEGNKPAIEGRMLQLWQKSSVRDNAMLGILQTYRTAFKPIIIVWLLLRWSYEKD